MSDVTETNPTEAKRRWRWWHIALGIVAAIILISLFGGSPDLNVTLARNGELRVQNTGRKPIDIKGVRVNDSASCRVVTMLNLGNPEANPWPIRLEVGEGIGLIPFCRAVRIAVDTSAGSATYEFK